MDWRLSAFKESFAAARPRILSFCASAGSFALFVARASSNPGGIDGRPDDWSQLGEDGRTTHTPGMHSRLLRSKARDTAQAATEQHRHRAREEQTSRRPVESWQSGRGLGLARRIYLLFSPGTSELRYIVMAGAGAQDGAVRSLPRPALSLAALHLLMRLPTRYLSHSTSCGYRSTRKSTSSFAVTVN
jgi:hypothetical protein